VKLNYLPTMIVEYSWGNHKSKPILIMNLIEVESVSYDCSFIVQNGEIWSCGKMIQVNWAFGHQIQTSAFE
jgi:hypothetical protein